MRLAKRTAKILRVAGKHSTASWAILGPATRKLDRHATPWDEPERDWAGVRVGNPLRAVSKLFVREKFFGTW